MKREENQNFGVRNSLVFKMILSIGITLLISIAVWAYFNIRQQKEKLKPWRGAIASEQLGDRRRRAIPSDRRM